MGGMQMSEDVETSVKGAGVDELQAEVKEVASKESDQIEEAKDDGTDAKQGA